MASSPPNTVDPITLTTVWHHFQTTCREMQHLVERTCQNYLMGQLRDISVGVWTTDGQMVAMPIGLPNQFLGAFLTIRAINEKFAGDLRPGDVILTNDPYKGFCNHLPDWGFFRPIFYKGELLFYTMVRAHQEDTGGSFPGGYFANGFDIHAEGLRIAPIKVVDAGVEREDLLELIWDNVRFPRGVRIDNAAMLAATKLAEQRVTSLLDRYGKETVLTCVEEAIDRAEQAVREQIRRMPDGTYQGESATDDDGTVLDEPVWVRADVTVKGDELTIDLSRSDPQRRGFVNNIEAGAYGVSVGAALLMMDAELADFHNEGSMRPIHVIAPLGSVVNAKYPATVGASPVNVGTQIFEAVLEALAKARPDRSQAAWGKHRGDYVFGIDPRTGERYVRTSFDFDGTAGAVWGHDGASGPCVLVGLGWIRRGNTEEMEVRVPWRVRRYEYMTDLMGAGRWRGGAGMHWEAVNEGSDGGMATGSSDGDEMLGFGAHGGQPSPPSRSYIQRGEELIRLKPHRMFEIKTGDTVIKHSAGGAGVGPPHERDPQAVQEDVRNELVSLRAARSVYKVALDPATLAIDEEATAALRLG